MTSQEASKQPPPIAGTVIELKPHERSESVQGSAMILMFIASVLACVPFLGRIHPIILFSPLMAMILSFLLRNRFMNLERFKDLNQNRLLFIFLIPINAVLYSITFTWNINLQDAFGLLPMAVVACVVLTNAMMLKPTPSRLGLMGACITVLILIQLAISQYLLPSILSGITFFLMWAALASRRNANLGDRTPKILKGFAFGLKTASLIISGSVPLMIAFFLLFPRLPLDAMRNERLFGASGTTGLSDSLTLGSISDLKKSQDPAFIASFSGERPNDSSLYWRSIVLDKLDGQRWISSVQSIRPTKTFQTESPSASKEDKENIKKQQSPAKGSNKESNSSIEKSEKGVPIPYMAIMDPNNTSQQITVLDGTEGNVYISFDDRGASLEPLADGTYSLADVTHKLGKSKVKINAFGGVAYSKAKPSEISANTSDLLEFLDLPPNFNPKTQAYGKKLREKESQPEKVIDEVLRMIRREEFRYTLRPDRLGAQAIDDFFFKTRAGFCEHYASTFVVLMRGAGIPARIVTGYLSGSVSGKDLFVSQGDAHAWAEVWLEGRGWVRQDPTAYIDPSRVDPDATNAGQESMPAGFLGFLNVTWRKNAASAEMLWKGTMLDFDAGAQTKIFKEIGLDKIGKPLLAGAAILIMAGLAVAWQYLGSGFMAKIRLSRKNSLSSLLKRQCQRAGIEKRPEQTWREFVQEAQDHLSKNDLLELQYLVSEYERITYGAAGLREPGSDQKLSERIKGFHPKSLKQLSS